MSVSVPAHMRKRLGNGMLPGYRRLTRGDWLELRHSAQYYCDPEDLPFYSRVDRRTGAIYDPDDGDRTCETELTSFITMPDQVVAPDCVDGFCPAPPAHPVDGSNRELDDTIETLSEVFCGHDQD